MILAAMHFVEVHACKTLHVFVDWASSGGVHQRARHRKVIALLLLLVLVVVVMVVDKSTSRTVAYHLRVGCCFPQSNPPQHSLVSL